MKPDERLQMIFSPLHGRLFFYSSEVETAKSDSTVLGCGRDARGKKVFTSKLAKQTASSGKGQQFVQLMRQAAEA